MTDPKSLFLKNKDLSSRWSAVSHADWFAEVLVYARASFLDSRKELSQDQLEGAKSYEQILCNLSDPDDIVSGEPISTGLIHELDAVKKKESKKQP